MWQPVIDPLMIRLSLKIQWCQLGHDEDDCFIDYEDLEKKIGEIRRAHQAVWPAHATGVGLELDARIAHISPTRPGTSWP